MKLTRKQLNRILLQLPHPKFVLDNRFPSMIQVPILEDMAPISEDHPSDIAVKIRRLTFHFSQIELDWVLENLDV